MTHEEEGPMVEHRSLFDTIPCPPPALEFPGGNVPLPKPTRADLVLSAQQWATAVREHWHLYFRGENSESVDSAMLSKMARLDAVLAELAEPARQ